MTNSAWAQIVKKRSGAVEIRILENTIRDVMELDMFLMQLAALRQFIAQKEPGAL